MVTSGYFLAFVGTREHTEEHGTSGSCGALRDAETTDAARTADGRT
jgi:hypothetical protein